MTRFALLKSRSALLEVDSIVDGLTFGYLKNNYFYFNKFKNNYFHSFECENKSFYSIYYKYS